jgi:hypothetical protein
MRSEFNPKRRAISVGAALALLGFPTIAITGCGGDSSPTNPNPTPSPTPTPSSGNVPGSISANHGHSVEITAAQLQAGGAVTLVFSGNPTHSHVVDLTADEVVQIRGGGRVSKTSTSAEAHTHNVTFN